jgi:hypothetical protein
MLLPVSLSRSALSMPSKKPDQTPVPPHLKSTPTTESSLLLLLIRNLQNPARTSTQSTSTIGIVALDHTDDMFGQMLVRLGRTFRMAVDEGAIQSISIGRSTDAFGPETWEFEHKPLE